MVLKNKKFSTRQIHCGEKFNQDVHAHSVPIYQSSTFVFKDAAQGAARFAGKDNGYKYTRLGNPTVRAFEDKMAALECGEDAMAFSSGMAAIGSVLTSLLKAGDHLVSDDTLYGCTDSLFKGFLTNMGIEVTFVDASDKENVKKAIKKNTKAVYIETPANPTMKVIDIAAIVRTAGKLPVIVDNTFATPYFQQPLKLGAAVVVHSATKFIGGHGDVVAGVAVASKEMIARFKRVLFDMGACISPFDAWLLIRGLKTLSLRMREHERNALRVAKFLEAHEKIEKVHYPGLESNQYHALAKKQMRGFGSMISFDMKGGLDAGRKLMDSVELMSLAVSLGSVDTLIQHPASMTHAVVPKTDRVKAGITDGLVRLSVGIEDVEDIIDDLKHALEKI